MNLSGGQNIVQPSSGNSGGGMISRLANIVLQNQVYAQLLEGRKDLETHRGKVKVDTDKAMGENRLKLSIKQRKAFQKLAFKELPDTHPDVLSGKSKPHPVTGRHYADPHLADSAMKGGINPDAKGQLITGAVSAINLHEMIQKGDKPGSPDIGKPANLADTQDAITKGFITPEQGADLSKGFNTKYSEYKSKNPGYKGSSEKQIKRVNSNLDALPYGEKQ